MGAKQSKQAATRSQAKAPPTATDQDSTFSHDSSDTSSRLSSLSGPVGSEPGDDDYDSMYEISFDDLSRGELLAISSASAVYQGTWNRPSTSASGDRRDGQEPVAIKIFTLREDLLKDQFRRDFTNYLSLLGTMPQHRNVVRFVGGTTRPHFCVVTELLPSSLQQIHQRLRSQGTPSAAFSFEVRMQLLNSICAGMEFLHSNSIVHGRLHSGNVLLDPQFPENCKIKDFSVPSLSLQGSPTETEGHILNEKREDVRAFGSLMLEILTPQTVSTGLKPSNLSVDRIIEGIHFSPDSRQRSAEQICVDLARDCLGTDPLGFTEISLILKDVQQLLSNPSFVPQYVDSNSKLYRSVFTIPNQLYGRDIEIATIKDLFQQTKSNLTAPNICILISGLSGVGKTAFVKKCFEDLTGTLNKEEFSFFSGKYDQLKNALPYSAIMSAFRQAVMQLVISPSLANHRIMKKWRSQLKTALGQNGQLIIDVLGQELELIIGKQKPPVAISADEALLRFFETFMAFVRTLATAHHKLTFFIDDLQWADRASFMLMTQLLMNPNIYFIGAYRTNEVSEGHPLFATFAEIKKRTKVHEINLMPPAEAQLNVLCSDTLKCDPKYCAPLTRLIYQHTNGNCFFFTEFFKSLHSSKLLTYSSSQQRWVWDLQEIEKQGLSAGDNVLMFMISQLQRQLSKRSQFILAIAATLGASFEFDTLRLMCRRVAVGGENDAVGDINEHDLDEILVNNYLQAIRITNVGASGGADEFSILGSSGSKSAATRTEARPSPASSFMTYRFTHDRIQQAAQDLFNVHSIDVKQVRLHIGWALLEAMQYSTTASTKATMLCNAVANLNHSVELIENDMDKLIELARLNFQASQQAKSAVDYIGGLTYARIAHHILFETVGNKYLKPRGSSAWDAPNHELAFSICFAVQQLEYVTSKNIVSGEPFHTDIDLHGSESERCLAFHVKGTQMETMAQYGQVLELAMQYFLRRPDAQNFDFMNATDVSNKALYLRVKKILEDSDFAILRNTHTIVHTDTPELQMLRLIFSTTAAISLENSLFFVSLRATEICLLQNIAPTALYYSLPTVAYLAVHKLRDFEFACKAATVLRESPATRDDFEFQDTYLNYLAPLVEPISDVPRKVLAVPCRQALAAGNLKVAIYTVFKSVVTDAYTCDGQDILHNIVKYDRLSQQFSAVVPALCELIKSGHVLLLLTKEITPEQQQFLPYFDKISKAFPSPYPRMQFYLVQALVNLILEKYEKGLEFAVLAQQNMSDAFIDVSQKALSYFLEGILRCRLMTQQNVQESTSLIDRRFVYIQMLADESYSANWLHYLHILRAERERARSLVLETNDPEYSDGVCITEYTKALQSAHSSGLFVFEAIANDLASRFFLEKGNEDKFKQTVMCAYDGYRRWGATARCAMLADKYGSLVTFEKEIKRPQYSITDASFTIHAAAASGNVDAVRHMLALYAEKGRSGADVLDDQNSTPLHHAALEGRADIVVILLAAVPQSDQRVKLLAAKNSSGLSALHHTLSRHHFDVADILLSYGADINAKQRHYQMTSLHRACRDGDITVLEFILSRYVANNVNLMTRDKNGDTALICAAKYKQLEIVKRLLQFLLPSAAQVGAPAKQTVVPTATAIAIIGYKDMQGYNLIHIASEQNDCALWSAVTECLTSQGKDQNWVTMLCARESRSSSTPLMLALLYQNIDLVLSILNIVNQRLSRLKRDQLDFLLTPNFNGDTPLHLALTQYEANQTILPGVLALIEPNLLPRALNARNREKETPLLLAKRLGIELQGEVSTTTVMDGPSALTEQENFHLEIEKVLSDDLGVKFLRRLCEQELNSENLDFLVALHKWRQIRGGSERIRKAKDIYDSFVDADSMRSLNIDMSMRKRAKQQLSSAMNSLDESIFDDIEKHIKATIVDTYLRFLKSDLHAEYLAAKRKK